MKKNSLLKAIVGMCLAYVVLSWIIPAGYVSGTELYTDGTVPVGLIDLIRYPIIAMTRSIFVLQALVVLFVGGLYAVLNKTGVYGKVVEGLKNKFKGSEFNFVIISVAFFAILTSLTSLTMPLFVLVPFAVAVIMSLGYKKVTAFMSTIGAILVGNMASTYGFSVNGYLYYFLGLNINSTVLYRIIFLVVSVIILLFAIKQISKDDLTKKKKSTKKAEKESEEAVIIPLYDGVVDKKKSAVPMIIVAVLTIVVALVSMYDWSNCLGIEVFNNIYEAVVGFEINGYPVFKNLLGAIEPFGYWTNYDLAVLLVIASLLIGWIYNLKFSEIVEEFMSGVKKMLKVALFVLLANIILLLMNSDSYGYNMFSWLADFFLGLTKNFNIGTMSLTGIVGGLFYNDFMYILNGLYSYLGTAYTEFEVLGLVLQYAHGFVMLFVPTSIMLVIGLTYLDIPYVEYLKKAWKYLLMLLAAIVLVIVVAALII